MFIATPTNGSRLTVKFLMVAQAVLPWSSPYQNAAITISPMLTPTMEEMATVAVF